MAGAVTSTVRRPSDVTTGRDGGDLAAAALRARPGEHGEVVDHHDRVLDEGAVRVLGGVGDLDDVVPEPAEQVDVGAVLHGGALGVDGLAVEEGQLGVGQAGRDGAHQGGRQVAGRAGGGRGRQRSGRGLGGRHGRGSLVTMVSSVYVAHSSSRSLVTVASKRTSP